MPFDTIAVEVVSSVSDAALEALLLDACSRAAQSSQCVGAIDVEQAARLRARVIWTGERGVRIEIGPAAGEGTEGPPLTREVTFADGDAPAERFRAAGFLVGTLASVLTRDGADLPTRDAAFPSEARPLPPPEEQPPAPAPSDEPKEPASPAPPAPSPPPGARSREASPRAAWLEVGPVVANGLHGSIRVGGSIGGAVHLGGKAHASLGASYSEGLERPLDVTNRWVDGTAGLLVLHEARESLAAAVRVEGVVTHLSTSLGDTTGTASGGRTLGGARVGVGGHLWFTRSLGLGVDGAAQWLAGSTDVKVDGRLAGRAAALGYVVRLGVLVGPF